eukprot:168784-Prorocentrum_lima.AAC.1
MRTVPLWGLRPSTPSRTAPAPHSSPTPLIDLTDPEEDDAPVDRPEDPPEDEDMPDFGDKD